MTTALPQFVISTDPQVLSAFHASETSWSQFKTKVAALTADLGLTTEDALFHVDADGFINVAGFSRRPSGGHGSWTRTRPYRPRRSNREWRGRLAGLRWRHACLPGLPHEISCIASDGLPATLGDPCRAAVGDEHAVTIHFGQGRFPTGSTRPLGPQWRECTAHEFEPIRDAHHRTLDETRAWPDSHPDGTALPDQAVSA